MSWLSLNVWRCGLLVLGAGVPVAHPAEPSPGAPASPRSTASILRRVLDQSANDPAKEHMFDTRYESVRTRSFEMRDGDGKVLRREVKRIDHGPTKAGRTNDESVVISEPKSRPNRSYQRRDFVVNEELLGRFDYTLAGRELVGGRPAWVIEFRPGAARPPAKDLKDRFLNSTAGRLWIDADESVVVQATFHLLEPVNVLGGLVGSIKRCETRIERARTAAGAWYTRLFDWQLEGRKLFAHRVMHFHEERSDVHPAD